MLKNILQCVPLATEPDISLIILPLMRILQRNLKQTTDTFLFISHTTNALLFKFRCNIFIGVRIIKEILGSVESGTRCIIETVRLNRLCWFGHVQRMEENSIPKRVLYMNLGTTRLRGRPRNRWQDEVREDGRIVGREGWQEKVHNRQE